MREVDELAVEPLARDLLDLELGVRQGETKELASGISGGAND